MPFTVTAAFEKFRKESVDLEPADSDKARSSRDYLFAQLKDLNSRDSNCPRILSHTPFGSFARKTKTRPLDDIDLLTMVSGAGLIVESTLDKYVFKLRISDKNAALARFNDGLGYVSSTKLLNQVKKSLSSIKNYSKSEIKRNQEAVVLNLTSYPWVFDIVPSISVENSEFFLIPDGTGRWKRTNPRRDTDYLTSVNKKHNGLILPTIRILKYWNRRTHKPSLSSYYFETLVLKVFDNSSVCETIPKAVRTFFSLCPNYLSFSCPDPKGFGPDLDKDVDYETKRKIKVAMAEADSVAYQALINESASRQAAAINLWKRVFGPEFPSFGS